MTNNKDFRIILIRGLPGSGKSWLLDGLAKRGYKTVDDPGRAMSTDSMISLLQSLVGEPKIAVADALFCMPTFFRVAKNLIETNLPDHSIDVVSFTNDPEQCLVNVQFRTNAGDDREVVNFISTTTGIYIPEGTIIPVYKPNQEELAGHRPT